MKHFILGLSMVILFVGCGVSENTTLSDLREKAFNEFVAFDYKETSDFRDSIKQVVLDYTKANNIDGSIGMLNNFTNCVMYNIWQKNPNQTLKLPLQACANEFNNGALNQVSYEDPSWILGQFDTITGEHHLASKYIKSKLNNPKSYEFIGATYNILQNGAQVMVTTEYANGTTMDKISIVFSTHGDVLAVY
ncbi:hypothetical protein B6S12_09955 [Helicobacter valdiviensis]|uniref:Uncharacterized protein n=1 Tax=Helicobacter valdiviensis TaxID=1458358 RepID=A0A2W6MVM8_9HELI|nr:hypothetical protein [Helicobacter valdiviensis]PZT47268.1 hypothetical protein B6S12_09955 [Helicobacter valdiviensis]